MMAARWPAFGVFSTDALAEFHRREEKLAVVAGWLSGVDSLQTGSFGMNRSYSSLLSSSADFRPPVRRLRRSSSFSNSFICAITLPASARASRSNAIEPGAEFDFSKRSRSLETSMILRSMGGIATSKTMLFLLMNS